MIRRGVHILALIFATEAGAAEFTPPAGCETFLTVQSKNCTVDLLWQCDLAPEGAFSEASFGPDGLESLVSYDGTYQWLDAVYLWDSSSEELLPPATDPIEMSVLLETGVDTFDFAMRRAEPDRSYDVRVQGTDRLTGASTVIDGFALDLVSTEIEIVAEDGTVEYKAEGVQYLSRELGHFFLGRETVFDETGTGSDYDNAPIDIILPGEPGFAQTTPLYECEQLNAGLAAPERENAG